MVLLCDSLMADIMSESLMVGIIVRGFDGQYYIVRESGGR